MDVNKTVPVNLTLAQMDAKKKTVEGKETITTQRGVSESKRFSEENQK